MLLNASDERKSIEIESKIRYRIVRYWKPTIKQ